MSFDSDAVRGSSHDSQKSPQKTHSPLFSFLFVLPHCAAAQRHGNSTKGRNARHLWFVHVSQRQHKENAKNARHHKENAKMHDIRPVVCARLPSAAATDAAARGAYQTFLALACAEAIVVATTGAAPLAVQRAVDEIRSTLGACPLCGGSHCVRMHQRERVRRVSE